ncbi:MAG: HAD-IC family P-type ATPase, partial [Thermodesulfobacteriota bacterium]
FEAHLGLGISGRVDSRVLLLGNRSLLLAHGLELNGYDETIDSLASQGKTVLFLAVDESPAAILGIADRIKDEVPAVISVLKKMEVGVTMLTGDQESTARAIGEQAGIENIIAGVLPDQKAARITEMQKGDRGVVAMVGDGINDAPALAAADVGIAMGTGIDIAIESGDIVVMKGRLDGVVTALALSRAVMRNIRQNLFWAFAYNVLGIPVAAGLLVLFGGPSLNPMIAGAAMAMSSVSVVTNALRLRYFTVSFP